MWAAGSNAFGQLGLDVLSRMVNEFVQVLSGKATAVAAGGGHSVVLLQDGQALLLVVKAHVAQRVQLAAIPIGGVLVVGLLGWWWLHSKATTAKHVLHLLHHSGKIGWRCLSR